MGPLKDDDLLAAFARAPELSLGGLKAHAQPLGPGELIGDGKYRLVRLLGEGGFGQVWEAEEVATRRGLAIKLLLPKVTRNANTLQRFELEIAAQARLHHPNIVAILDDGSVHGQRFFAMELVRGAPLALASESRRLTLASFLGHLDEALSALAHAHARGVIHRDLKPDNLFLGEEAGDSAPTQDGGWSRISAHLAVERPPRVKLMDFGIAHLGPAAGTFVAAGPAAREEGVLGSIHYMSPEQALGAASEVGPASDLYAVGVILYEALSGEAPFEGTNMLQILYHHVRTPAPPVRIQPWRLRGVPAHKAEPVQEALRGLVARLLEKRYEARPESAADVRAELRGLLEFLGQGGDDAPPDAPAPPPSLGRERPKTRLTLPTMVSPSGLSSGRRQTLRSPSAGTLGAWEEAQEAKLRPAGSWRLPFLRELPPLGRAEVQERLWGAAKGVCEEGGARLVVLRGPFGIGKGRLSRWVAEEVQEAGAMRALRLDLSPQDTLSSALHSALYQHLRQPKLKEVEVKQRIAQALRFEREEDAERLGGFLLRRTLDGQGGPQSAPSSALTAALRGSPSQEALGVLGATTLARVIESPTHRPLLLSIHTGGPEEEVAGWLLRVLSHPAMRDLPLLVVWSLEEGPEGAAGELLLERGSPLWRSSELIELGPLAPHDLRALALRCVPGLPEAALGLALELSQGNPEYLVRTLLGWWSEGLLQVAPDGPRLDAQAWSTVPRTLDESLANHLRAFLARYPDPEAAAQGLMLLARVGSHFPQSLALEALAHTGVAVAELLHERWLRAEPSPREPRLRFGHEPLRAVLLQQARAQGLEEDLLERCAELRLWVALGALARSDYDTALQELQPLLQQVELYPPSRQHTLRLQVLDALARVHHRQRDSAGVRAQAAALTQAAGFIPSPLITARFLAAAALWEGAAALLERAYASAEEKLARAMAVAQRLGDSPTAIQARLLASHVDLDQRRHDEAREKLQAVIREAQAALNALPEPHVERLLRTLEVDALRDQASVFLAKRDHIASLGLLRYAMERYERLDDPHGLLLARLQHLRALRHRFEAEPSEEARAELERHFERARALAAALQDRHAQATLGWEEASFEEAQGAWAQAQARYQQAEHLFGLLGDASSRAYCVNQRGEVARKLAQWSEALALYERFEAEMERLGHGFGAVLARLNQGWALLGAGSREEAARRFEAGLARLGEEEDPETRAALWAGLAAARRDEATWADFVGALGGGRLEDADARAALQAWADEGEARARGVLERQ